MNLSFIFQKAKSSWRINADSSIFAGADKAKAVLAALKQARAHP
jgi:hypothetical protein